jgi:molybdopterin converting factor small subunit
VDGPTVEAVLRALPVADLVFDGGGELRPLVRVYLDGADVRELEGAATPVPDGSELRVIASAAGGS